MSGMYEGAIQDLIDALGRLPGIGPKSGHERLKGQETLRRCDRYFNALGQRRADG